MSQEFLIDDVVGAGQPWSAIVPNRCYLTIVDLHGNQGVDFLCYNADQPEERYHAANTIKAIQTLSLTTGHALYSDVARPLMHIVDDSFGMHDTIAGCCSAPSNEMLYGVKGVTGCRENFLSELARHGMGRRDIVANINFFCRVPVDDNNLVPTVFVNGDSQPGDTVSLRADTNVLAVVSNCPQVNNPCNDGDPSDIRIIVSEQPWRN